MYFTYEEAKRRFSIVKEFCIKYRTELTYLGAVVSTRNGSFANEDEYIKYVQELTDDELAGSMAHVIQLDYMLDLYEKVLNGELTFEQYIRKDVYTEEDIERYLAYMI